MGETSLMIP